MFGYVRACKPQMKICDFEAYQGVYCTLCQALGKRYGFAARMTLSYDFTFLALLLMAMSDEQVSFQQGRCPFNPTKKRMYCRSDGAKAIDYAADVAMLLTYHKLCDTMSDERFVKRVVARIARRWIKRDYKRAVKRCPEQAQAAQEYMDAQRMLEAERVASVDRAAEPTAVLLSMLLSSAVDIDDDHRHDVERFGYCLGRYIYLADAADDLVDDYQSGNYNPYILTHTDACETGRYDAVRQYAAESLHACVGVCAECYELFDIRRFDGILRNVLYYGMPTVIKRIQQGKQEDKKHEKSV